MRLLIFLTFIFLFTESCKTQSVPKTTVNNSQAFIDSLLNVMTLDEKIGQMTLFTTDWGSTGPTIREGYEEDIRQGRCGALFNSHTAEFTRRLQKIAVEDKHREKCVHSYQQCCNLCLL